MTSEINHPDHYLIKDSAYEVINIIEAWELNFVEGNIIKYIFRYKRKNGLIDLEKAQWYLERLIKQVKEKK